MVPDPPERRYEPPVLRHAVHGVPDQVDGYPGQEDAQGVAGQVHDDDADQGEGQVRLGLLGGGRAVAVPPRVVAVGVPVYSFVIFLGVFFGGAQCGSTTYYRVCVRDTSLVIPTAQNWQSSPGN